MYALSLESAGMWVAGAANPGEAMHAVNDLRPDLVITDVGFDGDQLGVEFIELLKAHEHTANTPVIVVSGRAPATIPPHTRAQADLCLLKPVPPGDLTAHVNVLLAKSRALRQRNEAVIKKAVRLRNRSQELIARSRAIGERISAAANGSCPRCGKALQWVETGTIDGREYDYFHWCSTGCGLFCFERDAHRWVKLAG